ncbi:MAG: serine hydrolase [Actinomycetota bacterium]
MPILEPRRPTVALPQQPDGTPWPDASWPTGPVPEAIEDRLASLLDQAFPADRPQDTDRFGLSLSFVAVHRGRLVAERYGDSSSPDEQLISWSMAKSVTQALIGVLVADGTLRTDRTGMLEAWRDPEDPRSAITIDHLLRMVPGTLFNEDYVDAETSHCIEMLFGSGNADMSGYTAALPAVAAPNEVFNYSSGTSVLLCRILADAVGRGEEFTDWMNRVLLDPIGMTADPTFDDAGVWVGSSFLHATARDFARFGYLYLRDGVWDGNRILPDGWVDYARTRQAEDEDGVGYGAHWWIWGPAPDAFYASGYETQRILVDPAADLVLVRLGKTPVEAAPAVDEWLEEIRLLFSSGG